ncbi:MltF family protein [Chlorobium phaeovibrioides]|uniref:transglycosylase SLT domain-containing protein n=1 Tax=Chlorobium phaeovibrioides TaxID=1094 RepID=UPI0012314162|nr:transporter substrate-binding domain-containing protein [Chlorobium phaeovibrioides]QEQ56995.1 transporter substrate-binding domain-containing protein [Chlorobium phaeovibrioides]
MNIRTLIHFLKWLVPALALLYLPLAYLLFFQNIRDLDDIKIQGRARIILSYDPINYLIYRGTPMGFSYEAAEHFCRYLGVDMDVVLAEDINQQLPALKYGKGDIVAHNLTITPQRTAIVSFSSPLDYTEQVLIQRKPRPAAKGEPAPRLLLSAEELEGKTVSVRRGSAYYSQLLKLKNNQAIALSIETVPGVTSTSQLIRDVATGAIDYTVADRDIAEAHRTLYPNLDFTTTISPRQPLAWAVGKRSPQLESELNKWLSRADTKLHLRILHAKYYDRQYTFRRRTLRAFHSEKAGMISVYDNLIRSYAAKIGWDWRMLASLMYEESQFDANAVSWAGATGLMQLMPATAGMFKITNLFDPESNIRAGTRYLKMLHKEWKDIPDPETRLKFILASYNVGPGHVRDAQALAVKFKKDPHLWEDNVEHYLRLKSKSKYYRDKVTRYGYCNGIMPVEYTKNILARYNLYQQAIHL